MIVKKLFNRPTPLKNEYFRWTLILFCVYFSITTFVPIHYKFITKALLYVYMTIKILKIWIFKEPNLKTKHLDQKSKNVLETQFKSIRKRKNIWLLKTNIVLYFSYNHLLILVISSNRELKKLKMIVHLVNITVENI